MPETSRLLRFDGIYQCKQLTEEGDHYNDYLRFYEDGTVITESNVGTPSEIIKMFNKNDDQVSIGIYSLPGNVITFTCTSEEGTVDYKGTVYKNKLVVEWFSHINAASSTEE